MKAIMVMFDTLNRRYLAPYGCDWVRTPNFSRLAEHGVTFDNSYVGSLPCMPARRDMLTGRYNFLHRSWGPIEPYDDVFPEILKEGGVYSHLVTDHQHYWEDGGATYHNRYNSYEFIRGQEGDAWKGLVDASDLVGDATAPPSPLGRQDLVNRRYTRDEATFPLVKTFRRGIEFIETNRASDNWYVQVETFDPHEPFRAPDRFRALYPDDYTGPSLDWPVYGPVTEGPEQVGHLRRQYASLVSMCDEYLGRILDVMDRHDLWKDTLLIVNTDHGFLLGEHGEWAKCVQPFYNEVAHTPLFVWDPRTGVTGERRKSLVQLIDIAPTVLEFFGLPIPGTVMGEPLTRTLLDDTPVRRTALFGMHGGHVNITDGRYVYMRGPQNPDNQPLNNYVLMPTHMRRRFGANELKQASLSAPFNFTKGIPLLRVPGTGAHACSNLETMLFDLEKDPGEEAPYRDQNVEAVLLEDMRAILKANDAPKDQFVRLGLDES